MSPDGTTVLTGDDGGLVQHWRLSDGHLLSTLRGHTKEINAVKFFPDGTTALSGGADGSLRVWNVDSGALTRTLRAPSEGSEASINAADVSPDGRLVVSGGNDMHVSAWDPHSGELLWVQQAPSSYITALSFSADGHTVVSGSFDQTVRTWNADDGRLIKSFGGNTERGFSSVFMPPNGNAIAIGGSDGLIRLQDLRTSHVGYFAQHSTEGNRLISPIYGLAISPDGRQLVSSGADGQVKIWNTKTGGLIQTLKIDDTRKPGDIGGDFADAVSVSPENGTVAESHADEVAFWDIESGRRVGTFSAPNGDSKTHYRFPAIAFSDDGKTLAAVREINALGDGVDATYDNVFVWDIISRNLIRSFRAGNTQSGERIGSIAIHSDGRTVFVGGDDGSIERWDIQAGARTGKLNVGDNLEGIWLLPNNSMGVAVTVGGIVKLLDLAKMTKVRELEAGGGEGIRSAAISPDKNWIFLTGNNGLDALVDLRQMSLVARMTSYAYGPAPAYVPDWIVVDQNTRFDARTIEDMPQISWIVSDQPFSALSPEIFIRDYYEPRLLPRLIECHEAESSGISEGT